MIKVNKTEETPTTLQQNKEQADEAIRKILEGGKTLHSSDFDGSIYAASDVKEQLDADQYGKCAYCEAKVMVTAYGVVEHFRPKTCWQQAEKQPMHRPGYYWLAYDWNNLLLACEKCNTSYKRTLFPLKDNSIRASNNKQINIEEPLLINPLTGDPGKHLVFHQEKIVYLTPEGEATIKVCGLNRPELDKDRAERYTALYTLYEALYALDQVAHQDMCNQIKGFLQSTTEPKAEYSAMANHLKGDCNLNCVSKE